MSMYIKPRNRSERRMEKTKKFRKILANYENKMSNPLLVDECISDDFLMQEGKVGQFTRNYHNPRTR
jgi:hypothetical protein